MDGTNQIGLMFFYNSERLDTTSYDPKTTVIRESKRYSKKVAYTMPNFTNGFATHTVVEDNLVPF